MGSARVEFLRGISLGSLGSGNSSLAHLAKIHALDTFTTQRGSNGGTGTGLASPDNELDNLLFGQRVPRHDGMLDGKWMSLGRRRKIFLGRYTAS